jgi:two-component system sensor histidine kinase RegB
MPAKDIGLIDQDSRGQWVRLRTLTLLRWLAIFGQLIALFVADQYFGLLFNLSLCYLVVITSVVSNLLAAVIFPKNKRLSEVEVMATLLFDLAQLSLLLYLTGGMTNPFALLILAPVTISASVLPLRTTVFLGGSAIALISALAVYSQPLSFSDGTILATPPLFVFGHWLAIVIGIVFMGFYSRQVATEIYTMSSALLATQMALSRAQKLTDLGGVVAAAAHELGTPLATIKLASSELVEELSDHPALRDDAILIREQADRCSDILQSMGRAGKDDEHLRQAPLEAVLREAAEPHLARGRVVTFTMSAEAETDASQPVIFRKPEIVHGLRNLIQNAVDFSHTNVWVEAHWDDRHIHLLIVDDGAGFPTSILSRIGEPFLRTRRESELQHVRPGYEGMGLGLFIAKTLLERSGATVKFFNGRANEATRNGAMVKVSWPRAKICTDPRPTLSENQQIRA